MSLEKSYAYTSEEYFKVSDEKSYEDSSEEFFEVSDKEFLEVTSDREFYEISNKESTKEYVKDSFEASPRASFGILYDTSTEASSKELDKEANIYFKTTYEYNIGVTTLSNNQIYALSVRLCKENEELDKGNESYRNHMKSLEWENERLRDELNQLKRSDVKYDKCETCYCVTNEIEDFHETFSKLTTGRDDLDIVLSNQIASYNKSWLGYQPNNNAKSFMSICPTKMKNIRIVYKCNHCHKSDHLEFFF